MGMSPPFDHIYLDFNLLTSKSKKVYICPQVHQTFCQHRVNRHRRWWMRAFALAILTASCNERRVEQRTFNVFLVFVQLKKMATTTQNKPVNNLYRYVTVMSLNYLSIVIKYTLGRSGSSYVWRAKQNRRSNLSTAISRRNRLFRTHGRTTRKHNARHLTVAKA